MSISFLRARYPCLLARMVYQVGRPAMFDGKRFLPLTGIPMPKILLSRTLLADCEPDPLTVATWMLKSLMTRLEASFADALEACWPSATSPVAIGRSSLRVEVERCDLSLFIIERAALKPASCVPQWAISSASGAYHRLNGSSLT